MDRKKRLRRLGCVLSIAIALATATAHAATSFNLTLNFTGGLTATQQTVFGDAATFWEGHVTGYQPGIAIGGLTIDAGGSYIDGAGGVLGQAGPTAGTIQAGYTLATTGTMAFDTADLSAMESNGSLYDVILHEMAHVMGFGTLWVDNGVYVDGTGEYTGANALAAYRNEFNQPGAAFVPVELGGGAGTANAHWNENNGGSGLTGITDGLGRDMRDELMTGWMSPNPANTFVSRTTLASFTDIGFLVVVPEPTGAVLLLIGVAGIAIRSRRAAV